MPFLFSIFGRLLGTLFEARIMGWVSNDDLSGLWRRYAFYAILAVIAVGTIEMLLIATGHEGLIKTG